MSLAEAILSLCCTYFIHLKYKGQDFIPRTPQSYDYHCSLLSGPLASEDSITYGVNLRSPLNDIDYFHVANSQLPQDVMHIILEGVLPRETTLLINECVQKGYFTILRLNERISCFPFSPEEVRDRPSPVADNGSLHQSCKCEIVIDP